jgi:diacylglycerol kinase (ATP)
MDRKQANARSMSIEGSASKAESGGARHAESPYKSRGGPARIREALVNSVAGLAIAFRIEAAFRQELGLIALLAAVAFALPLSVIERVILFVSMALVLVVELVNSALEAVVDRISLDNHDLSRRAKDLGSAAVFLSLVTSGACWVVLATPALSRVLS